MPYWNPFVRRPVVGGVEARAGFLDRPVLTVLVASVGLAMIAFGMLLLGKW